MNDIVPRNEGWAKEYGREDTLAELLLRRAAETPNLAYAIFPEEVATLAELRDRALEFARGLVALGLRSGDHVAILMPNCLDYMVAHFGIQLAGGIGVLPNARYRSHELLHVVRHSDSRFLVTSSKFDSAVNYSATLTETYPELAGARAGERLHLTDAPNLERIILFGDDGWNAALPLKKLLEHGTGVSDIDLASARTWQSREDMAVMYYTSGTTSLPKACEITHAGLQRAWSNFTRTVDLQPGEKVWVPMPFFHSGGIGLMAGLLADGAAMASAPYFEPESVLDMIERHRIEILYPGFHLLAAPVLESPRFSADRFPFIRALVVIGPLGRTKQLQSLLPKGAPALNLFGMSEASGLITLADFNESEERRLTTCGRALPGIEVMIGDPETGAEVARGESGEILFRGGGAFKGYHKDAEATAKAIRADGFIRTGDLGRMDEDGTLSYVGRLKDMLRVGGENFAAAELESFISQHPAVANVQVIGRPDERLGEVPVAFVELRAGRTAAAAELIEFCTGKIARFKIPREVRFVTEWPMSATKIQKFKLKELLDTPAVR